MWLRRCLPAQAYLTMRAFCLKLEGFGMGKMLSGDDVVSKII